MRTASSSAASSRRRLFINSGARASNGGRAFAVFNNIGEGESTGNKREAKCAFYNHFGGRKSGRTLLNVVTEGGGAFMLTPGLVVVARSAPAAG